MILTWGKSGEDIQDVEPISNEKTFGEVVEKDLAAEFISYPQGAVFDVQSRKIDIVATGSADTKVILWDRKTGWELERYSQASLEH